MTGCAGRNRRGEPCARRVRPGAEWCHIHAPIRHGDLRVRWAAPDPDDVDAVNRWLRRVAVEALAGELAAGTVSPQSFDYYRRALLALHAEHHARHVDVSEDDPVAELRAALDAVVG